jgi:Uma2 family endonuclease
VEARYPESATYDDYRSLETDDRYELIEGEFLMVPSPESFHQDVSRNIEFLLLQHVNENDRGVVYHAPLDVKLTETDVVQPDILFIGENRREIIGDQCIEGPPDLVIEILSPSTAERDLRTKKDMYARENVQEYWIVSPEARTVEIFIPDETSDDTAYRRHDIIPEGNRLNSDLLDDFTPSTDNFFER